MRKQISKTARRVCSGVKQWLVDRLREFRRCHECGAEVSPWDDCCPHCGSGHPAKVSISAGIAFGVVCVFALLLGVVVF